MSDLRSRPLRHALKQAAVTGTTGSLLLGTAVVGLAAPGATAASAAPATGRSASTAGTAAPMGTAQAAPVTIHTRQLTSARKRRLNVGREISTAASLKGRPYRYGATGPRAFDCSGYTLYVLKKQSIRMPRTAAQQYAHTMHISRRHLRTGDLIFFYSGGRVYHVGIYAGKHTMWHAPHSGTVVKLAKIYGNNWKVGRVV